MQCPCGAEIIAQEHKVKTSLGADRWAEGLYTADDLPLTIEQHKCHGCGRSAYQVFNNQLSEIFRRGM